MTTVVTVQGQHTQITQSLHLCIYSKSSISFSNIQADLSAADPALFMSRLLSKVTRSQWSSKSRAAP